MFRKSQNNQGDLFSGISSHVSDRKQKMLSDPNSWHQVFYREIVSRVDEEVFSVLFCGDNGRPNASIRVLIGMMILKEGNGWSDEQLFDECRFNIKVLMALGYLNLDEDIPVESTYYLFRRQLMDYNEEYGTDLLKKSFTKITKEQIQSYKVSGKKIRLDSKLINSNIALCTRIDLILETIRVFIKGLDLSEVKTDLKKEDYELLLEFQQKSTTNLTYHLSKEDKGLLLHRMGHVIKTLLIHYEGRPNYEHLQRLYEDQYKEVSDQEENGEGDDDAGDENISTPQLKEPKELSSSSMQSIHDPQATFRAKGHGIKKQHINGYHANLTETCDESNDFNLIIDAQLDRANLNEDEFLLNTIESSEALLQSAKEDIGDDAKIITHATTDGGYDSNENRKQMAEPGMPHWNMAKGKGGKQTFRMYYDADGNLQAIDKKTGTDCTVGRTRKGDKIVITVVTADQKKSHRYFTDQKIENYILLQNIQSDLREEDKNLRANVESTIHQSFHRLLKRNKIKYRGQYKCNMYVISRALWVNFRRIYKNVAQNGAYFMFLVFCWMIDRHRMETQNIAAA